MYVTAANIKKITYFFHIDIFATVFLCQCICVCFESCGQFPVQSTACHKSSSIRQRQC